MATARKNTKTIKQEVTVYTLELSEEDACSLLDHIKHQYMGSPASPGWSRRIRAALENVDETTPLAVGDRVRVTEDASPRLVGMLGELLKIDPSDEYPPFKVCLSDTNEIWWVSGVEKI